MNKTKIEWADSTWNPVTGCFHKCEYCYARRTVKRFGGDCWWIEADENKLHELNKPVYNDEKGRNSPYPFGFDPTFHRYRLSEYEKKKGRTIFVCSMADLFGSWVPDSWIEEVFAACEKAPQHRYLFLTKNPQRYADLAKAGKLPKKNNMWYGTTVISSNKQFFYGATRNSFVSIEPILRDYSEEIEKISTKWIIVGAETGNRKGKVVPKREWIEAIVKECERFSVPLFMKDSLIPIMGEENMKREFPWDT